MKKHFIHLTVLFLCSLAAQSQIELKNWKRQSATTTYSTVSKTRDKKKDVTIIKTDVVTDYILDGDVTFERVSVILDSELITPTNTVIKRSLIGLTYRKKFTHRDTVITQEILLGQAYRDQLIQETFMQDSVKTATASQVRLSGTATHTLTPKMPITLSSKTKPAYTHRQKRQAFEHALFKARPNAGWLFAGLSYMPAVAYRQILVHDPLFDKTGLLSSRSGNERPMYGHTAGLTLGINVHHKHLLYLEVMYGTQGFTSDVDSINWQDGSALAKPDRVKKYTFSNLTLGLGYSYRHYNTSRHIGIACDLGAYYTVQDSYSIDRFKNERYLLLEKNRFGLKTGLGIVIKPDYMNEIKIMPTLRYDLSPVYRGSLTTRLYNIGVTLGYGINCFKLKK